VPFSLLLCALLLNLEGAGDKKDKTLFHNSEAKQTRVVIERIGMLDDDATAKHFYRVNSPEVA
jgi:hypothetical protein